MNLVERKMVDILTDLRENHHCEGVKAEFEAEGTRLEEALRLKEVVTKAGIALVEVHISNPHAREESRHNSVISGVATGVIAGFGFDSYLLALVAIGRAK